jgi:hypothetical protein
MGDELIEIVFHDFKKNSVKVHQYSYKNLFGTCARLCKIVQPSEDQKLQVSQAMSKF